MKTDEQEYPRKSLIEENERILKAISARGVDLCKNVDIEFSVFLPNKEACIQFRSKFRSQFRGPKGRLFMVVTDQEKTMLLLSAKMKPTSQNISLVEQRLIQLAHCFGGADVYWEFKER